MRRLIMISGKLCPSATARKLLNARALSMSSHSLEINFCEERVVIPPPGVGGLTDRPGRRGPDYHNHPGHPRWLL